MPGAGNSTPGRGGQFDADPARRNPVAPGKTMFKRRPVVDDTPPPSIPSGALAARAGPPGRRIRHGPSRPARGNRCGPDEARAGGADRHDPQRRDGARDRPLPRDPPARRLDRGPGPSRPVPGLRPQQGLHQGLGREARIPIYLAPKPDAGVLAIAAKGDKTEITGLDGRWTQVQLQRDLVGYVQLAAPAAVPAAEAGPVLAPVPSAPAAPADAVGKPAEADASATSLSRTFEGQVEATSRTLFVGPKPPFPWQLVDPSGARIAYLDLSQLLLTQQIDQYVGHTVDVFGPASPVGKTGDVVVQVQSLQSK